MDSRSPEDKLLEAIFGIQYAETSDIDEKGGGMGLQVKIKKGTPKSGSICLGCKNAHVMQGQATSERRIHCTALNGSPRMTFDVAECSSFSQVGTLSLYELQKIAYILVPNKGGQGMGFMPNKEYREKYKEKGSELVPIPPDEY